MGSSRSVCVWAWVGAVLLTPLGAWAQSEWIALESAHFLLYTDTNTEKGQRLLEDLEARHQAFSETIHPLLSRTVPDRVVLLDDRQDYLGWLPETLQPYGNAAYLLHGSGGTFVLARDSSPESIAEDVGHSLGHLFLSRSLLWTPFWLQEGVGEYVRQLGRDEVEDPVSSEDAYVLADILSIVSSRDYDDLAEGGTFRRQAAHLVRVLLRTHREPFRRYLESLRTEEGFDSRPEVSPDVFGATLLEYEDDILGLTPVGIGIEARPVAPSELNALLGDLAATAGFQARARNYYRDSSSESARVGLAVLGREQPAARRTFEQLVEDFPESGMAHYHLGTLEPPDSEARRMAQIEALERSVELMPLSGSARAELALRYALEGRDEEAILLVHEALEREPERGDRFYEILAEVHMRLGDYERATECIQIAATLPHYASDALSLERYDRLVLDFYRRMETHRREQEADRLEQLRLEVEALVEEVDPRPLPAEEPPAPIGRVAYSISSGATRGVTGPQIREAPMPDYAPDLRQRSIEGRVVLQIELDRRGRISSLDVVSSENPELSEIVLDAVRLWRFEPARRGFESTAYSFRLTVTFYLEQPLED